MTKSDYDTLKSSNTLLTVVDKNGNTITDYAASYDEQPDKIIITIKHNGKEKNVTINISN